MIGKNNNKSIPLFLGIVAVLSLCAFLPNITLAQSAAPNAETQSASVYPNNINADIYGQVSPNGAYTDVWFEYGLSSGLGGNNFCNQNVGSTNSMSVRCFISSLQPNKTYYYRVIARNNNGISFGTTLSFNTSGNSYSNSTSTYNQNSNQYYYNQNSNQTYGAPPLVWTQQVSSVSDVAASLNANVDPNGGNNTSFWFQYGTTSSLGSVTTTQYLGNGSSSINVSNYTYGLLPNTTYYYQAVAQNDKSSVPSLGSILNFRTSSSQQYQTPSPTPSIVVAASPAPSVSPVSKNTGVTVINNTSGSRPPISKAIGANLLSSTGNINPVSLETDKSKPSPGDEFNYTVNYTNKSDYRVNGVVLRVILPAEVEYISSSVPPTTVSGGMLLFNLGIVDPNSQIFITVRVKVSENAKPGSNLIFTLILEYTDFLGNSQSASSYLTVQVGEKNQNLSGSIAGLIGGLGSGFMPLLWMALGTFVVWVICYIVYRKYFKNGNGNGHSNVATYRPPPTVQ